MDPNNNNNLNNLNNNDNNNIESTSTPLPLALSYTSPLGTPITGHVLGMDQKHVLQTGGGSTISHLIDLESGKTEVTIPCDWHAGTLLVWIIYPSINLFYSILFYLSYPILSYPILSYPILSYPTFLSSLNR